MQMGTAWLPYGELVGTHMWHRLNPQSSEMKPIETTWYLGGALVVSDGAHIEPRFKHVSNIRCQRSVVPFSLIQPLFICLTFFVSTLHLDSSVPPLTLTTKHLDIAHFPMPLLLSGILCLIILDTFSQPLHLELL